MNIKISEQIVNKTIETALQIQQVPAPTFGEKKRAELVYRLFHDANLKSIKKDVINNVYGFRPGTSSEKLVLITAHLDTVFPDTTDLTIKREAGRIAAPGLGDNALAISSLLTIQAYLDDNKVLLPFDICFVANSCEEGLGDLQGIKKALEKMDKIPSAVLVLEGLGIEELCFQGIGSKRYKIDIQTPGGHSWSDYGQESAIHTMVDIAAKLTAMDVCQDPKTSFNIGTIEGGTSVNTIAQRASCLLDFRSESSAELENITNVAEEMMTPFQSETVKISLDIIGHRPAGKISENHWFKQACMEVFESVHNKPAILKAISTDANIPLSKGIPAVCIGLTTGGNVHRLDEYIEISPLKNGLIYVLSMLVDNMEKLKTN
jgi:tripeptide aminopeptidase